MAKKSQSPFFAPTYVKCPISLCNLLVLQLVSKLLHPFNGLFPGQPG